ncbi:MAG: transcriptional regulator [Acidobacteriota bacterium]
MTGTIKKINKTKFGMLLAETLPAIIGTEAENKRALENVEWLMKKSEGNLSPEETSLFSLLVRLIEDFEEKTYSQVGSSSAPRDVLTFLMDQHGLKQKDLVDNFNSSGTISQVLKGEREIIKSQAKALASKFKVAADLFI